MRLSGWGRYPLADATLAEPHDTVELMAALRGGETSGLIARGLGRSYGDSALADVVVSSRSLDHLLGFDDDTGDLTCGAGTTLADILDCFVPRGWFLPVTPGTKQVTVGGAIASDIHGKNHHGHGCFSDHVTRMAIATVSDGIVECSPAAHQDLFRATCGGMGLTGVIVDATIKLIPIRASTIRSTTIPARNLDELLQLFARHDRVTYSVAWIDCLASGPSLGRSLLMLGEHDDEPGRLAVGRKPFLVVPIDAPAILLNRHSMRLFNAAYYGINAARSAQRRVHYEPFFYPLDGVGQWNRLYGRAGLTQYQFVIPAEAGAEGVTDVLERIVASQRGSFLAVLKAFGPQNFNHLSFPTAGYTLALDFRCDRQVLDLLDELDRVVLSYGGRVYLSKDARMSEETFKSGYPRWPEFAAVRRRYRADLVFNSHQSQRLGI
jgi:FAD/FMN-containing dehydrogenase